MDKLEERGEKLQQKMEAEQAKVKQLAGDKETIEAELKKLRAVVHPPKERFHQDGHYTARHELEMMELMEEVSTPPLSSRLPFVCHSSACPPRRT